MLIMISLIIKIDINTRANGCIYFNKRELGIGRRDLSLVATEGGGGIMSESLIISLLNGG
jgi:hypothetical protein